MDILACLATHTETIGAFLMYIFAYLATHTETFGVLLLDVSKSQPVALLCPA